MTTEVDLDRAPAQCSNAKVALANVSDAIKEFKRIEDGGARNPNWPDPRGSVGTATATGRYLAKIEQALKLPEEP